MLTDGCGPTHPPATTAQPLMRHFAIAFFNGELRGSRLSREQLSQARAASFGPGVANFTIEP